MAVSHHRPNRAQAHVLVEDTKKMAKKDVTVTKDEAPARRKFLKGAAGVAVGAAAAAVAAPHVAKAATVLKVQAAWGGGIFLEFAQDYVDRVNKMAGGAIIAPMGADP